MHYAARLVDDALDSGSAMGSLLDMEVGSLTWTKGQYSWRQTTRMKAHMYLSSLSTSLP